MNPMSEKIIDEIFSDPAKLDALVSAAKRNPNLLFDMLEEYPEEAQEDIHKFIVSYSKYPAQRS